jgi:hypothetical protein
MKKLIAILATAIAAGGFSASAQDWTLLQTSGNGLVWDNYATPGTGKVAGAGDVNVEALWSVSGADLLGSASGTNGAVSASAAESEITSMLSGGGGWTLAQNFSSGAGAAALGTVETASGGVTGGKGGSIVAYNGGNPFEISSSSTGASGSTIEMILIGFNGSASSWQTATALGWSGMINEQIGTTAGDPNATEQETSAGLTPFGVNPVPEPATLALAGLGGLSMLFLRRRKA